MASISIIHGPEADQPQDGSTPALNVNIGTRKSKLALAQTDLVVGALMQKNPKYAFSIKARDTAAGDIDKVTPFRDMPVKNIWTHELETLMLEGQLDILVHSLKDVPTALPPNCEIGGVLERADPRDVLVIKKGRTACRITDLPAGSVIGTSSIRRTAQIALKHPHLVVQDIRGNIGTRLDKLDADDGPFDAIVIAAAGLLRIGLGDRISQYLDSESGNMLHAVSQGAIGIENRSNDTHVSNMIQSVNHQQTFLAITVERSLLRTIEGGCSAPLGVETKWLGDNKLQLKALVVSIDGKDSAEIEMAQEVVNVAAANEFGTTAASALLKEGADKILAEIKAKKPTTVADLRET